jgi:hypothetical protein
LRTSINLSVENGARLLQSFHCGDDREGHTPHVRRGPIGRRQSPKDRPASVDECQRLNQTRNAVMHPAKNKGWDEDDFTFVHNLLKQLRLTAEDRVTSGSPLQQSVRFERRRKDITRSSRRNEF